MREASQHIDAGDVVPWLKDRVKETDLSLLTDSDIAEYHASLSDIHGGYAGKERRKWGVERRALCLLLAWTNEIIAHKSAPQPKFDIVSEWHASSERLLRLIISASPILNKQPRSSMPCESPPEPGRNSSVQSREQAEHTS